LLNDKDEELAGLREVLTQRAHLLNDKDEELAGLREVLPNARTFSMKRMKSLPVYAKFLPNARTCSMKRMKSLPVYVKLSPRARYGFKSWKTRCSKSLRSDSTQFSVNAASKDFTGLAVPIPLVS